MGNKEFIQILLVLIPLAAFLSASLVRSRVAYWILRVGGLLFALAMTMAVLADYLCGGTLSGGITQCAAGLTGVFRMLGPILLTIVAAMLTAGPVLLVAAVVAEVVARSRKP